MTPTLPEDSPSILPILTTKLYRPPVSPDLEQRVRLIQRLEHNRQRPLTLISAPAGYGKTMLASMWLESCSSPSAWISLDEEDNDLNTFLSYILAAIGSIFPDLELKTHSLQNVPNPPRTSAIAHYLLNDLNRLEEPFLLTMDDIHLIKEQSIYELLNEMLLHPPHNMHLVMIGRHDPPLQISSLRARGQVTEIRSLDLRFTSEETALFMQKMLNREIDPAVASEWTNATEGWVTALHLAALSLRHRGQADDLSLRVRGDSRYLRDYLFAEVLSRLPISYQNYLVKISILDRFCRPLCEAICQTDESPESNRLTGETFIDWLEDENLFLIPLDNQHQWFRFHHLFRELLLDILQVQTGADEIAALRRRASSWFTENGMIYEALKNTLNAGDTSGAVELVDQYRFQLINQEQWDQLTSWIELFPDDVIDNDPVLAITKAHLPSSYGQEDARLQSRAKQLVADLPTSSPIAQEVKGEITYFDLLWRILTGPATAAIEQATDALALLPQRAEYLRSTAVGTKAIALQMSGDYQRGVSLIDEKLNELEWSNIARAKLRLAQSYVCFMEGNLKALQRYASMTLKIAIRNRLRRTTSEVHYLLGISHYLRNEMDLSEPHLSFLVDEPVLCDPVHLAQGVCALTRIYRAQRQPNKSSEVFGLAFSYLEEVKNTFSLDILHAFQVELALDHGDLALARRLSRSVDFDKDRPLWYHYSLQLTRIKLWLAERRDGSLEKAMTALERLSQKCIGMNRKTQYIDVLALQALVHEAQGDRQMADKRLTTALRLGEAGGFIRSFTDLGAPMANLLLRVREQETDREYADYIERILGASPHDPLTGASTAQEILTDREYEVLSLLAKRLSNKEIAGHLVISLATVKSHTLNIYNKLGVNNRKQAVGKALELSILLKDKTVS